MRFEKKWGYALGSYRIEHPRPDESEEIVCSDFRREGDVFLPFKVVRTSTYRDSTGELRHPISSSIVVQKYVLNDPANTKEGMLITWPAKARVIDVRTDTRIAIGPTSRPLPDDVIAAELERQLKDQATLEDRARSRIEDR
jgi:hypothetical protein